MARASKAVMGKSHKFVLAVILEKLPHNPAFAAPQIAITVEEIIE